MAAKAHAARRANRAAKVAVEQEIIRNAVLQRDGILSQIADLEAKLSALGRAVEMNTVCHKRLGNTFPSKEQIVQSAAPWGNTVGVYFLIDGDEIVYVGQSINIMVRISTHNDKKFDRYAYIACDKSSLDFLESIYIHFLRPRLNGDQTSTMKCAPMQLKDILEAAAKRNDRSQA